MQTPTVVGIAGSLRQESFTRRTLAYAMQGAENAGAKVTTVDLRDLSLPVFNPDDDLSEEGKYLKATISEADAIIIATPVYHGSYSSTIKNAIDYCGFDEFENKTVGLLGVAGGRFPITALEHLRTVCRSVNAWVLPYQSAVPRVRGAFDNGELADPELRERVETLGEKVVQYAAIRHIEPGSFESQENVGG